MSLSTREVKPTGPLDAKIFVVGEAPGADEDEKGIPFIGRAGDLLWDTFKRYGVYRNDVRVTNLCNYRPQDNDFSFCLETPQLDQGIKDIQYHITQYKPNVIAATGANALSFLTGRYGILAHRSSILPCVFNPSIKVVPTIHPAYVHRLPEAYLFFDFDIHRVVDESKSPYFNYTERNYIIVEDYLTGDHIEKIKSTGTIAVDIEATKDKESGRIVPICICLTPSPFLSITIAWNNHNYDIIKSVLEDEEIVKVFHFGWVFDIELLHLYGINVRGISHDTYLMQQTLDPGLPKSLAFLTTTYTREPYYKKVGRDSLPEDTKVWGTKTDKRETFIYNAKDGAVTIEIYEKLCKLLISEEKWQNYEFKLQCAEVAQKISRNGMLLDNERLILFRKALIYKWTRLQQVLDMMANRPVNVNSHQGKKSVQHLLYEELGLPPRRNRKGKLRADEKALLSLIAYCKNEVDTKKTELSKAQWTIKLEICKTIIDIVQIRKLISSYIDIDISVDSRVRSSINVGGPETNRWAAQKYVDGTGLNMMTFPRGSVHIPDDLPEGELEHKAIIEQLRKEMRDEKEAQDNND